MSQINKAESLKTIKCMIIGDRVAKETFEENGC